MPSTHRHTDHATCDICSNRPHLMHCVRAMRPRSHVTCAVCILCAVECPDGKYGPVCEHDCSCEVGAPCDRETGRCRCPPGTFGPTCAERCPDGRFGLNCDRTCRCRGSAAVQCSAVTGQCSCSPGFVGDACQLRELFYYSGFRFLSRAQACIIRQCGN